MKHSNSENALFKREHLVAITIASLSALIGSKLAMNLAFSLWYAGFVSAGLGLGLPTLFSTILAWPLFPIGAFLGFGLYVQICKLANIWPMTQTTSLWNTIFGNPENSIGTKLRNAPSVFWDDCKRAFRALDRQVLLGVAEHSVTESSPEYKQWVEEEPPTETGFWANLGQKVSSTMKKFSREQAVPLAAQTSVVQAIHKTCFEKNNSDALKGKSDAEINRLLSEYPVAFTFLYDQSLVGKGLIETVVCTAYYEYNHPIKLSPRSGS